MSTEVFLPALAFGTLFAVLWFGVYGLKGVKKAKREGYRSALANDGEDVNNLNG